MRRLKLKNNSPFRAFAILACVVFFSSCFGRIDDSKEFSSNELNGFGLDPGKPALVVFSALWCKPCLSEIPSINRATEEFRSQVQVLGIVVEGASKGETITEEALAQFISPNGDQPVYRLRANPGWTLLDPLNPPSGRALPTFLLIDRDHKILQIVQRSMEYETELIPALKALAEGSLPPVPAPTPTPMPGTVRVFHYPDLILVPGYETAGARDQRMRASWVTGRETYAFLASDMPFEAGEFSIRIRGEEVQEPLSAEWIAEMTGCSLTVYFNEDGSYRNSHGICH